jgi:hypothetical protein
VLGAEGIRAERLKVGLCWQQATAGPGMPAERYKTIGIVDAICEPGERGSSSGPLGPAVQTRSARGPASRQAVVARCRGRREWAARLVAQGGSEHVSAHSVERSWNSRIPALAGGSRTHRCSPINRRHKPASHRTPRMRERLSAWPDVDAPFSCSLLSASAYGSPDAATRAADATAPARCFLEGTCLTERCSKV